MTEKYQGLNSLDVQRLKNKYGLNEIAYSKQKSIIKIFVEIMREPMFILLVSSATLYIFLGDYKEGLILLSATILVIFITFFQYRKAENALAALRKLATPRALVLRDNIKTWIIGRDVVPGDIVFLNEGDRIVADAILLEENNLWIDEAILTGESMPVKKAVYTNQINFAQNSNNQTDGQVFSGTLVVQGNAVTKVIATGVDSKFGQIGIALNDIKEDITKLQIEMKALIKRLFFIGILVSVVVIIAFYFSRGGIVDAILNGISTSMAVLPEEFPVVLTVFLAIGAWRLSKIKVLTRKPSAIETLGAVTVLCVDKTGTITMNSMEIACLYDGVHVFGKDQLKTLTSMPFDLIEVASLASTTNATNPMENAIQSMMERIILIHKSRFQLDKTKVINAYPLTNECPCMTNIYASIDKKVYHVFTKGAPEYVFKLCGLNDVEVRLHESMLNTMAQQSLRVIAIASADYYTSSFPNDQADLRLNFRGLIAFEDPIRSEVPFAMKECKAAGVKVKMMTGDFPITAKSIANQIGLDKEGIVITGQALDAMSDDDLLKKIKSISVFARVAPAQKLRIVHCLKMQNEVVAMTGDGVNDAPALKAAHIGIAMGKRGTEVAREAASLVLLDDNFASIVAAIRQGRKIFDNLQKAMGYILAIHIPIIGLTLLPVLNPTLPFILLPLHIICLELVIDPVSSIAFESEVEEKNIMQRPPRNSMMRFFGTQKIILSIVKGFCLFIVVLIVLFISKQRGLSEEAIRTVSYATLVLGNSTLVLNSLSKTRPFYTLIYHKNIAALSILFFAITLLVCAINFPFAQTLFKFENPGIVAFIPVFMLVFMLLLLFELHKLLIIKGTNNNQCNV